MKSIKTSTRILVCSLLLSLFVGCSGPNNLTRNLHQWNGEVDGKWGNEGIFVAFVIFPVYFFSLLGDIVIFNSIEFWGEDNPISPPDTASMADSPASPELEDGQEVALER